MKRILILVEGQTEETFVRVVLSPYLTAKGIHIIPKVVTTKRVKSGPDFKGGILGFEKVKNDIVRLLGDTNADLITTMIDFYGLPEDFPGMDSCGGMTKQNKLRHLEESLNREFTDRRFVSFIVLHEFEAFLFSSPLEFQRAFPGDLSANQLVVVRDSYHSPEDINDGPTTHPSMRIKSLIPAYQKAVHGPVISARIGIEAIRISCPHFDEWLRRIETVLGTL